MEAYDYHNIIKTIDDAVSVFGDCVTESEKTLFNAAMNAARELDYNPATGRIRTTTANIARLAKIKSKLESAATSDTFLQGVRELAKTFGQIHDEQLQYFRTNFAAKTLDETSVQNKYAALRKATVENTIEGLTGQGLRTNVTDPISKMLMTAVTTGEKYADLTEQLRADLMSGKEGASSLARYAGTYATTAMTQYAGQQNRMFTDDLDIKWFRYVGSTIETTRRFCELLTQKEYIHISEIPEILKGNINVGGETKTCPINPKTGLPYGLIEGTTPENFAVNVGGWNCRHQLVPIAAEAVPKNIREQFENKTPEQEWWEKNELKAEEAKKILKILLPTTDHLALFRANATVKELQECYEWAWQKYAECQTKQQNLNKRLTKLLTTAAPAQKQQYAALATDTQKPIISYVSNKEYTAYSLALKKAISDLKTSQKTNQPKENQKSDNTNQQTSTKQTQELTKEKLLNGIPYKIAALKQARKEYIQKLMQKESKDANKIAEDINYFTDGNYEELREYQAGIKKNKRADGYERTYKEITENIEDFIKASPKWSNESYRGIGLTKDEFSKLKEGTEINMQGQSSWSADKGVAERFAIKNDSEMAVLFKCESAQKYGTSIACFSSYHEHEILCSKDARWKITKIRLNEKENYAEITVESL